jgi:hypothetical protein
MPELIGLRKKDQEFMVSLGNMEKPYLNKTIS